MVCPGMEALGDIYTYTDKNGVVHFTNVKKGKGKGQGKVKGKGKAKGRGKKTYRYKRIYKAPKKKGIPYRKGGDLVPARDNTKTRFKRYDAYIKGASRLYRIPIPLIRAIIKVESDYDPRVVSSKGAKGLMQMMPETARDMGVVNVFDPRENIYGGTRYLRVLANMFNGDLILTIAAHHAGPGSVKRYKGIPPFKTTRKYVRAVLVWYYKYRTKRIKKLSKRRTRQK